jgi:hypothetical protein
MKNNKSEFCLRFKCKGNVCKVDRAFKENYNNFSSNRSDVGGYL